MKTFKKQNKALQRNDMKSILAGGIPPGCDQSECNSYCISIGLERGMCDTARQCICGPFIINQ